MPIRYTKSDITNMTVDDMNRLNRTELAAAVRAMNDIARKRIKRIEISGKKSPAVNYIQKTGGIKSVKNKDINTLRTEYIRLYDFLSKKTSTLGGLKAVYKQVKIKFPNKSDTEIAQIYDIMHEINEELGVKSPGSPKILEIINSFPNPNFDELKNGIERWSTQQYEQREKMYADDTDFEF